MATFVSQHRGLRITYKHTDAVTYANGIHDVKSPGDVISFAPRGQLTLDDESDAEKIAFLRGHRWYGTRFEELGAKAQAERPTLMELSREITKAAATLNVDRLDELLATEQATHNRPDAITLIEQGLVLVADLIPVTEGNVTDSDAILDVPASSPDVSREDAALAEVVGDDVPQDTKTAKPKRRYQRD